MFVRIAATDVKRVIQIAATSWRGAARAEDAQGTPTQSHISPSIPDYEDIRMAAALFGSQPIKRVIRIAATDARGRAWSPGSEVFSGWLAGTGVPRS